MGARLRGLLGFAALWLALGFAAGTLVLLGPVRWTTAWLRATQVSQRVENLAVAGMIAALVTLSFGLTVWLWRRMRAGGHLLRIGIPLLATAAAAGALGLWLSPRLLTSAGSIGPPAARFTFGAYPDVDRLRELRELGYAGVITLLHPAVVPFEPVLLEREREAAKEAGIPLIHLPLLPWIGDNAEALERLRRLAEEDGGPYYVHCYLGRDRIRLAERVVRQAGASTVVLEQGTSPPLAISEGFPLERGTVHRLDDSLFLTPYPTDEELLLLISNVGVRSVVSLLDPGRDSDTAWIRREREALRPHGVRWVLLPVPAGGVDSGGVAALADSIRKLPRPAIVHGFLVPSSRSDALLRAFGHRHQPMEGGTGLSEPE